MGSSGETKQVLPRGARASGADGVRARLGPRIAVRGNHLDRERARFKQLERENVELRRANAATGVGVFCEGGARPSSQVMVGFIDDHRETFGVDPICVVLPIAPSRYYELKARGRDPPRQRGRGRRGG